MRAIAALLESRRAVQTLRRSVPKGGPQVVSCRGTPALYRLMDQRLVEAVVLAPSRCPLAEVAGFRAIYPAVAVLAYARFRPDDGTLLVECHRTGIRAALVEGVDDPILGEAIARSSLTAERRAGLAAAPRLLRLTEPLQREVWEVLVEEVERPVGTDELAHRFGVSREHLSRQVGAGGAPNLKRLMDLTRTVCAAQLLSNPGYTIQTVVRLLRFTSSSHLSRTARRIVGVPATELGTLAPRDILLRFVRGKTRSRV
jgi:AraC-like DNA-binding protein